MSLSVLKRKTSAKYGNHTNKSGFSINGNTSQQSYIGKPKNNESSCFCNTMMPINFKSVKNYNAYNKHGNITRWYKRDYTQGEWDAALLESGLTITDYPYPPSGKVQFIKNNWVQRNEHDTSSHIYTHSKKQRVLNRELECKSNADLTVSNNTNSFFLTTTGVIRPRCAPIDKDIGLDKGSETSLERIKYKRALHKPRGYEKPFPYTTTSPTFRACTKPQKQAIDALKSGYYNINTPCPLP